jgi:ribosomal protein S18 acetylase RimI-like enzyme
MPAVDIRAATAADAGVLLQLIRELAFYEKAPDAVVATEADLLRHGFGPHPAFEALLAFAGGRPAGFALYFTNFSTWLGRPGIYLEDIFVSEWARRLGVGRGLMTRLAAIAIERDYGRLDFSVLHWNPARGFYEKLGFRHMDEWRPYRAEGEALRRLAAEDRESR